jgi:hypothetical protein
VVINVLVAGREVPARISNLDADMPFEVTWTQDCGTGPSWSGCVRA